MNQPNRAFESDPTAPGRPTAPPVETCSGCGKPFVWDINPDWANPSLASLRTLAGGRLLFSRVPHPECEDEERKRQEQFLRDQETLDRERRIAAHNEIADQWYQAKALPVDVRNKTWATLETTPDNADAVKIARKWLPQDDFGILINGPAGTGKSHMGFAMLNAMIEEFRIATPEPTLDGMTPYSGGRLPYYVSVSEMLAQIRGNLDAGIPSQVMERRVVMFDDLGAENITDWSREIFFRIFEHRLNRKFPTIVTTNLSLNELKERMHERVVSRILGLCIPLTTKGRDRRRDVLTARMKQLAER